MVTFRGRWHQIEASGIKPLPVQRPIPIWFGGSADAAIRRAARLGDGWIPLGKPDAQARGMIEQLRAYLDAAGREPAAFGIEGHLSLREESAAT